MNIVIARFVSLDIYGLYTVASSASSFAAYVTDPITTMLFPVYSRIRGARDTDVMQTVYRQTIRYSTAIVLPAAIFLIVFAKPFTVLLFGEAYSGAGIYLTVLAGSYLLYGLGSDPTTSMLTSQGYTRFTGTISVVKNTISVLICTSIPFIGFFYSLLKLSTTTTSKRLSSCWSMLSSELLSVFTVL